MLRAGTLQLGSRGSVDGGIRGLRWGLAIHELRKSAQLRALSWQVPHAVRNLVLHACPAAMKSGGGHTWSTKNAMPTSCRCFLAVSAMEDLASPVQTC